MLKRIKQSTTNTIATGLTFRLAEVSMREDSDTLPATREQVSMFMAEMGRKGGKVGGKRRLQTMTAKERSAAARKAAKARWDREDE
jgi:hypothetical protein